MWDPDLGSWIDTITAQVGDEMLYRLRFNTTDGATPERDDISLGYIALTDWIPPGTVVSSYATPTVSDWADFSDTTFPTTRSVNPTTPASVTLGSLQGYEWFLGDVAADGWWETTFTVLVVDEPVVQDGLKTGQPLEAHRLEHRRRAVLGSRHRRDRVPGTASGARQDRLAHERTRPG